MSDLDGFLKHYLSTEGKDGEVEKLIERWEKWKLELPKQGVFPKLPFDDRELEYLASETLDGLKYLEKCPIAKPKVPDIVKNDWCNSCILKASEGGYLKTIQWLLNVYPRYNDDWYYHNIFLIGAQKGHLDIVEWSSKLFPLSEVYTWLNYIFKKACRNGYLEVAKWIYTHYFELDPYFDNNYAFRHACQENQSQVVEWLLETFPEIDSHFSHDIAFNPFVEACRLGHLRTAKILYEKLPDYKHSGASYLLSNVPVSEQTLFSWACSYGYLDMLIWLYEVFPDIRPHAQDCGPFQLAVNNDRIEVIRWFIHTFPDRYTGDLTARDPWVEYRTKRYLCRHVSYGANIN